MPKLVTDPRAVKAYASLNAKSRDALVKYLADTCESMSAGRLTVRVLAASMRAASVAGDVPLRHSHAQWFPYILAGVERWADVPVGKVASAVVTAGHAFGADGVASAMEDSADFADFRRAALDAKKAKSGGSNGEGEGEGDSVETPAPVAVPASLDALIVATLEGVRRKDAIRNVEAAALLVRLLAQDGEVSKAVRRLSASRKRTADVSGM